MKQASKSPGRWRSLSLVMIGIVLGAAMLSPAFAGPLDPVTNKKFKNFKKKTNTSIAAANASIAATNAGLATTNAGLAGLTAAQGVLASFKNGPGDLDFALSQIVSLALPAGNYALFSKITVRDQAAGFGVDEMCELRVGTTVVDSGWGNAEASGDFINQAQLTVNLMAAVNAAAATTASLWCGGDNLDDYEQAKIMAIEAPTASNVASAAPAIKGQESRSRSR